MEDKATDGQHTHTLTHTPTHTHIHKHTHIHTHTHTHRRTHTQLVWKTLIVRHQGIINDDLDIQTLAWICTCSGYTAGSVDAVCRKVCVCVCVYVC